MTRLLILSLVCGLSLSFGVFAGSSEAGNTSTTISENIAGKFHDVYTDNPKRAEETFQIGTTIREELLSDGVLRLILFLPDGTTKVFDLADDLRGATVKALRSVHPNCQITYLRGGVEIVTSASMHLHPARPIAFEIVRRSK